MSMLPFPDISHQSILGDVMCAIEGFVSRKRMGELLFGCDVYLDEHSNVVLPDIIVIAEANLHIIKEDAIHGVPDIIIEILSQSNSKHDRVKKKELYERFGVKEYWIINPYTKETIGYTLQGQTFIELGRFMGSIKSVILDSTFSF